MHADHLEHQWETDGGAIAPPAPELAELERATIEAQLNDAPSVGTAWDRLAIMCGVYEPGGQDTV